MNILLASSEVFPFSKTGGLADMVGALGSIEPEKGLKVYFIEQPDFFDRAGIYFEKNISYQDNDARYIFFSKCVVHLARYLPWRPDVVHVHDWQVALVPAMLQQQKREGWGNPPPSCLTIHNLAYQGVFPGESYSLTNLAPDFFNPEVAEY